MTPTDPATPSAGKPAKPRWRRFRYGFIGGGTVAVLAALLLTDPDKGLTTGLFVMSIASGLVAVLLAHWTRKALHDYPEADARFLFRVAGQSPVGAGLALVALALVVSAAMGLFGRAAHAAPAAPPGALSKGQAASKAALHPRAVALAPTLRAEIDRHWPELPWPHYVPALIDHESGCPGMRSCWQPTARLKSQREEGAGLGQLTRAWRPDGSLRFDALAEMRDRHPALRQLDWATIYQRPDLQIRSLVLMSRDNWHALRGVADYWERLAFADAAYNGGLGGVGNERRACGLSAGCDPQRWFGHVERHCLKSRQPLYAGRSACDINRAHTEDVLQRRMPGYRRFL